MHAFLRRLAWLGYVTALLLIAAIAAWLLTVAFTT